MKAFIAHSWIFALLFVSSFSQAQTNVPGAVPTLNHIVWVWLENVSDADMIEQPFTKSLLNTFPSAHFTAFSPTSSVTQADVISMISGFDEGVTSNDPVNFLAPSLIDLLEAQSISWKVYAEDFPGSCFLGVSYSNYYRYRVPFLSVSEIESDRYRCQNIMGFANYQFDVIGNVLPQFTVLIPNLMSSGGIGTPAIADASLKSLLKPMLANPTMVADTTFIVSTTNISDPKNPGVFTLILGNGLSTKAQQILTPYNHYNMLQTIESALGLGSLNENDATAAPMVGFWN